MPDPAAVAQRQQAASQGLIWSLITLPIRLFGVLCGALLLSILIECIGLHFFWPNENWHHAQSMLYFELDQLSTHYTRSALVHEPGRTAYHAVAVTYEKLFVQTGLLDWVTRVSRESREKANGAGLSFSRLIGLTYVNLEAYILAAVYTLLTFLVRLLILLLTLPLLGMAAFVGAVDGLVRRDIRRFEAARESGFLYHRAKAGIGPVAALPWVIYLALPVSVRPMEILVPSAGVLGAVIWMAAGSFKKHL